MNSKNHKKNTNFQIKHFLVGSCHTADGAYSLLLDLKEEREGALTHLEVQKLKAKAKKLKLEEKLVTVKKEYERLNIEAQILELENRFKTWECLLPATLDELNFINECIDKVQILRKYKHLDDVASNEATQQEEWKLELIWRAENYLLTEGRIPSSEFSTMRMHPEFDTAILPEINRLTEALVLSKLNLLEFKGSDFLAAQRDKLNAIKYLNEKSKPKNILDSLNLLGE